MDLELTEYTEFVFYPTSLGALSGCIISSVASAIVVLLCLLSGFYKEQVGIIVLWINLTNFVFCSSKILNIFISHRTDSTCQLFQAFSGYGQMSSVTV